MCEKIQRAVKQSAKMGLPQVSPYLLFFAGEAVAREVCDVRSTLLFIQLNVLLDIFLLQM